MQGRSPPAFAVSPTVDVLGSEYLFVGLGCGMVGVHSMATGKTLLTTRKLVHTSAFVFLLG